MLDEEAQQAKEDRGLIEALSEFVASRAAIENTVEFMQDRQAEELARAKADREADRRRRRFGAAAFVLLLVVAAFTVRYLASLGRSAQRSSRTNADLIRGVGDVARQLAEQGARLEAALDPHGCVATRNNAQTQLLIIGLNNTIHRDNGHPEEVTAPTQTLVDESEKLCPGDPGGPPILDANGKPVKSAPTTTAPAPTTVVPAPAAAASKSTDLALQRGPTATVPTLPTTTTTTEARNTTITIPTPPGSPAPPPVQVPAPNTVLTLVTTPTCNLLNLLCDPKGPS